MFRRIEAARRPRGHRRRVPGVREEAVVAAHMDLPFLDQITPERTVPQTLSEVVWMTGGRGSSAVPLTAP